MEQKKTEFNKVFNAWDILVIAFGAMIGWGWVVSSGGWIQKGGVLDNVTVRVRDDFELDMHIDTDDANAFLIKNSDWVELIKKDDSENEDK